MSESTNIQWCDSTINPIMGCGGCELYLPPNKILDAIDRACIAAGEKRWKAGTASAIFGCVLDQAWTDLREKMEKPGLGHLDEITSTNLRHLRKRFQGIVKETFSPQAGKLVLSIIDRSLKCYAAQLHANRGFNLEKTQRQTNAGYAPTFEQISRYPGRLANSAKLSNLFGTNRLEKPWLNGLPRSIFVSDMGDAFSRKQDFAFLREEIGAFQTSNGRRHLWLWLTKRPRTMQQFADSLNGFPPNVCAMTTVTSAKTLHRVDALRKVKAAVRGLSLEPLWGPVADKLDLTGINWVIVGGESGAKSNVEPFQLDWALALRNRCREEGVAFFVKQLGRRPIYDSNELQLTHKHGGDWSEWPAKLRVREMPVYFHNYSTLNPSE